MSGIRGSYEQEIGRLWNERYSVEDFDNWAMCVKTFEVGKEAVLVERDDEGSEMCSVIPCVITKITRRSECASTYEFGEIFDRIIETTESRATAEFTTDDDIMYVEVEEAA